MTTKERRFVEEYIINSNATTAAIRAGYSEKSAKYIGYRLRQNPIIAMAISERLKELFMSAEEAGKHLSDIARTRLNDYLIVRKKLTTPTVRKGLQQLIDELDAERELEKEFARVAGLEGKELEAHQAEQRKRELQRLRYALELKRNPNGYRDVVGEPYYEDVVELDLIGLSQAYEQGRIKKLSFNEHGPTVEMYPADKALRYILQLTGRLVQRHEHRAEFVSVDTSDLNEEEKASLVELALKVVK
ncbi:hypothetical protein F5984_15155 [Rudanella paleaurantiibacter]|uniref:Terminase small subunit n=1 Tax=Rudanella paleaurantiibacter TaxID=2614655 RepID=A0A7J5TZA2_9BACT|nr:terminase small subunit [Rudanella paleaurantiibacter]KAB7730478.1 hypothetical protein F5984_15155 [Rudanella paleaurantiibacter]